MRAPEQRASLAITLAQTPLNLFATVTAAKGVGGLQLSPYLLAEETKSQKVGKLPNVADYIFPRYLQQSLLSDAFY